MQQFPIPPAGSSPRGINRLKTRLLGGVRRGAFALAAACAMLWSAGAQAQPTLLSIYPDGTIQFQPTNSLAFTLSSTSGLQATNISVILTATNLWLGTVTTTNLTSTNGLTVAASAAGTTVTTPLIGNTLYSAAIIATDSSGTFTLTNGFDTVTPSYTWEAEDFNYTVTNADGSVSNGLYIDNPQTNAYGGLVAEINVDAFNPNNGGASYRPVAASGNNGNLGNEITSDKLRAQYVTASLSDYDQGWNNGGSGLYGNFTRHYPAGKWNIFARMASWAAGTLSAPNAVMYQNGPKGTLLGEFVAPNTWESATYTNSNEYQNFVFVPLVDVAGDPIEWDSNGDSNTLTLVVSAGSYNMNFFMLMPVNTNIQPKPFVSGFTPNVSTNMFPTTSVLSFVANSVPGLSSSNVTVTLNGYPASGVTYSGSSHSLNVSVPVASNVAYQAAITVTDAYGTSTYDTSFGTFRTNYYTWEAEDFDYFTNSLSAQFFDNPQVDAYTGLSGQAGVDVNNNQGGNSNYRPAASGGGDLGNETTGDVPRAQYLAANDGHGTNDYDVGWTAAGQWANYTRHFPVGTYNIYMRGACPNAVGTAGQADAISFYFVTNGVGTSVQNLGPKLGQFNIPSTGGYQNWTWTPLVDSSGLPVAVSFTNTNATTIRMNEDNGDWNANFFMLVPLDTARPVITQIYPNGTVMFQPTNSFTFVVSSSAPINTNLIAVTLNGAVVSDLTFSGSSTNLTISSPIKLNGAYEASVVANTTDNDTASTSLFFNTFAPTNYTWEAEDWDYTTNSPSGEAFSGLFFNNPQVDAYNGLAGTPEVDATNSQGGGDPYRFTGSGYTGDLGNEVTGDVLRPQYGAGTNDYDVGWTAAGNWANYTRNYPEGTYNVYLRASSPNAGGQPDAASLYWVTKGLGTVNQTLSARLGVFNIPATGGYQTYTLTPLVDSSGNPVVISATGAASTLRLNEDNGGFNFNYFMLVPAVALPTLTATASGANVVISWSPTGGELQSTPVAGPAAAWTVVGTNNPATVPIGKGNQFFRVAQ